MARDQAKVTVPANTWAQLTNSDATAFSLRVIRGQILLRFTAGATEPAADAYGLTFADGVGIVNRNIADMCALSGANRIWAKAIGSDAEIYIDHA